MTEKKECGICRFHSDSFIKNMIDATYCALHSFIVNRKEICEKWEAE